MKPTLIAATLAFSVLIAGVQAQQDVPAIDRSVLPGPPPKFEGKIEMSLKDSKSEGPAPVEAASPGGGGGATPSNDAAELAKKLSNPVASLISLPFQFNYDEGFGPNDAGRVTLNVQPVIPVSLNKDWNLIIRTIVPFVEAESPAPGVPDARGVGDIVQSFFFSPKQPTSGGWIWAVGPVFLWPSATDNLLGGEQWGAGPTALVLKQQNGWTYGALANHIWSYAGPDDRADVNTTFIQPFVSYTNPKQTTYGLNTESTYNWDAGEWTIPINLTVSQLVKVGGKPIQFMIGARYYAESPDGGPEWGLRAGVTLLFPK